MADVSRSFLLTLNFGKPSFARAREGGQEEGPRLLDTAGCILTAWATFWAHTCTGLPEIRLSLAKSK